MMKLYKSMREFFRREDGPTAIEYAVMMSLIIAVCAAAIRTFGSNTSATFTRVANSVSSATGS